MVSPQTPGLTFDWIHKNLYWADAGDGKIVMAPGQEIEMRRITLVSGIHPYGIAVHPKLWYSINIVHSTYKH